MNDEPWGQTSSRPHAPACPLYPAPYYARHPLRIGFQVSVSRALRGIAIRLVVGPNPYYILVTIPLILLSHQCRGTVMRLMRENENRCANESRPCKVTPSDYVVGVLDLHDDGLTGNESIRT